jgi:hypothetical protein
LQDDVPLRRVKARQIKIRRQWQHSQFDPVLERVAGHPCAAGAQRNKTVAKAGPQTAEPTTVSMSNEDGKCVLWRAHSCVTHAMMGLPLRTSPSGQEM